MQILIDPEKLHGIDKLLRVKGNSMITDSHNNIDIGNHHLSSDR